MQQIKFHCLAEDSLIKKPGQILTMERHAETFVSAGTLVFEGRRVSFPKHQCLSGDFVSAVQNNSTKDSFQPDSFTLLVRNNTKVGVDRRWLWRNARCSRYGQTFETEAIRLMGKTSNTYVFKWVVVDPFKWAFTCCCNDFFGLCCLCIVFILHNLFMAETSLMMHWVHYQNRYPIFHPKCVFYLCLVLKAKIRGKLSFGFLDWACWD